MQMHAEGVDWSLRDFIVMGVMIGIVGGVTRTGRAIIDGLVVSRGSWLGGARWLPLTWANLAVGIVGSEHNPANQLFFFALLIGIVGSVVARGKSSGMAKVMLVTAAATIGAFVMAQLGVRDEPMVRPLVEGDRHVDLHIDVRRFRHAVPPVGSRRLVVFVLIADEVQLARLDLVGHAPVLERFLAAVGDPHFGRARARGWSWSARPSRHGRR